MFCFVIVEGGGPGSEAGGCDRGRGCGCGRGEKLGDEQDVAGAEKVQFPVPRQSQIQFQVTAAGAWSGCRVQVQLLVYLVGQLGR